VHGRHTGKRCGGQADYGLAGNDHCMWWWSVGLLARTARQKAGGRSGRIRGPIDRIGGPLARIYGDSNGGLARPSGGLIAARSQEG
jgi:hypothetical protein